MASKTREAKGFTNINPSHDFNEQNAVERWFKSKEAAEEERICLDNWNKCAVEGERIGTRAFVRFANWARFTLGLEDKNRVASYSFSNKDFDARTPKWLPKVGGEVEQFELLPQDWNPNKPPQKGK